jgi:hypothetical protein
VDCSHVQTVAGQSIEVYRKAPTGAYAAHTGHFAGARLAVTDRADLAESLEPFPGSLSQSLDIHLFLPSSI